MSEAAEAVGVWASEHGESPCAVTESPGLSTLAQIVKTRLNQSHSSMLDFGSAADSSPHL